MEIFIKSHAYKNTYDIIHVHSVLDFDFFAAILPKLRQLKMSFRLDRFLSLYFFHPLVQHRRDIEFKIPILMYHGISSTMVNSHPYYETNTSPKTFQKQIKYLKENSYLSIDLDDAVDLFSSNRKLSKKYVIITFDDGLLDFYLTAFSILKHFDFTATVFLPAGLMGQNFINQPIMSWKNASELSSAGVTFGSHTVNHPKLIELKPDKVLNEIMQSKHLIEEKLDVDVNFFSYPYAFPEHNKPFIEKLGILLNDSGYQAGVTTKIGRAAKEDNLLFLKRLPINEFDDIPFFKAKLEGGYDWLYPYQHLFKKIKGRLTNIKNAQKS